MATKGTKTSKRADAPIVNNTAFHCASEVALADKQEPGGGTPSPILDGIGPGAHAAGVDNALKVANLKHLRRIEGQVRGLAGMVEEDRYCADIITQVSAVRESLQTVARNLMRNHLQHCAAKAMRGEGMTREAMVDELMELVAKLRT